MTLRDAKEEKLRRLAQRDLLSFMQYVWWMPSPLKVGRHTRETCERLTRACEDYLAGKTTRLLVNMPFRHGKSDIVSRALPAYFLGRCAEREPNVIMCGYGSSLIEGFSLKAQEIVRSEAYRRVFPAVRIDKSGAAEWSLKGSESTVYAVGLGGSLTGKGGNLIVIDDYCKNRAEAEQKSQRDKMWNSFKDDLLTRVNSGGGIIVVCATRWHEDDISGRLKRLMAEDPSYPRYEEMVFPARRDGEGGWDTLFPELYAPEWYADQRRQLGPYSSAALLDCSPVTGGTALFRREWIQRYSSRVDASRLAKIMLVDGAKSKASTADYTCALVVGQDSQGNFYLLDGEHARFNLAEKIDMVFRLGRRWRPERIVWEQVGAMSDVEALRMEMDRRLTHWKTMELSHNTNKDYRIRRLVVPFSQGRVFLPEGIVKTRPAEGGVFERYDLVDELVEGEYLPYTGPESTPHDDIIDCLADLTDEEVLKVFQPPVDAPEEAEPRSEANVSWDPFA